MGWTEIRFRKL